MTATATRTVPAPRADHRARGGHRRPRAEQPPSTSCGSAAPDLEVIRLAAETYEAGALGMHASPSLFGGDEVHRRRGPRRGAGRAPGGPAGLPRRARPRRHPGRHPQVRAARQEGRSTPSRSRRPGCSRRRPSSPTATRPTSRPTSSGRPAAGPPPMPCGPSSRRSARTCASSPPPASSSWPTRPARSTRSSSPSTTGARSRRPASRSPTPPSAGNAGEALRLLRHAIATGVDPVPIVAVLAQQLRQLVKVGCRRAGPVGRRRP